MSIITKPADTPFFDTGFYTQPRYLIVQNLPLSFAITFSLQKMNLEYLMQLRQSSTERQRRWLQQRSLLANPLHCGGCNTNMTLVERSRDHVDGYQWRCTVCRKKRSLRTNSFFEKYPKIPLGELIVLIYFWSQDEQRRRAARMMSLSENLVCRVFRSLEDICSADIERNPFIPFPGTAVVKCDESKFNHKAKYNRGRRASD
ncbi:uncharacterized protein LOC141863681 isoform X2 [Acropora palmata]|uniref:uncharacterized protein LOC141863681 isoform X2 n=1 Tax=Acropora palmata TaxID=6131 RepID=UPI003D9FFFAA